MVQVGYVEKHLVDRIRKVDLLELNSGRKLGKQEKTTTTKSNPLEWLVLGHVGMVTEHFRVWLEKYLLQSL